jgi:hypothetical protein
MRYLILIILLFTFSKPIQSQENRKLINGAIKLDSFPIHDVHIMNMTTNIGTISNDLGIFSIPVKLGDHLSISHLNLKNVTITITKKNINTSEIGITLTEQVTLLKAFTLEESRVIFEQDTDILTYNGPTVNAQTLKLPYANSKVNADKVVFKIRSGAVVNLENLFGKLNGDYKRAIALKKLIIEDQQLLKIRNSFTDDFFITDLQIQQDQITSFLNFCVQKNIIQCYLKKENLKLTKILIQESKSFPQKENSEIKISFKKNEF